MYQFFENLCNEFRAREKVQEEEQLKNQIEEALKNVPNLTTVELHGGRGKGCIIGKTIVTSSRDGSIHTYYLIVDSQFSIRCGCSHSIMWVREEDIRALQNTVTPYSLTWYSMGNI